MCWCWCFQFLIVTFFMPKLLTGSPVFIPTNDQPDPRPPNNICPLPPRLGHYGYGVLIEECDTLDRFVTVPPCNFFTYRGSSLYVCCPPPKKVIFPGTFGHPDYTAPEDDYVFSLDICGATPPANYDDNYVIEYEDIESNIDSEGSGIPPESVLGTPAQDYLYTDSDPAAKCILTNGSSCVVKSLCSLADFSGDEPSFACGNDAETGEDKFCCRGPASDKPLPKPDKRYGDYKCRDYTDACKKFVVQSPDSCSPSHSSFRFMKLACMESCGLCGDRGCADEFEKCYEWARKGLCIELAPFMIYHCRESCGTCGFRSVTNTDQQVVNGRDYTNIHSSEFFCGEGQLKADVNAAGEAKRKNVSDEFSSYATEDVDYLDPNHNFHCGSVIINDKFVLTAAHCNVAFRSEYPTETTRTAVLRTETLYAEEIEHRRIFIHPEYEYNTHELYYDIAVIELGRRIIFDYDTIGDSPACLGDGRDVVDQIATGQGYGATEKNEVSKVLLEVNVTVMSNDDCAAWLNYNFTGRGSKSRLRNALPNGINDQFVCTRGIYNKTLDLYSGPCRGDSGGPLYFNYGGSDGRKRQTVIGLQSGTIGCGRNTPAWWTRVYSYKPWVECIIREADKGLLKRDIEKNCKHVSTQFDTENEIEV